MERTASCACGGLRAICSGEPLLVSLCHCQACQRRTGSSYGLAAFFDRSSVRIEGSSREFRRPSDSGHDVIFHFCPDCGASVYWEPTRRPDRIAVGVGGFADPHFPKPSQAVYREYRHDWLADLP